MDLLVNITECTIFSIRTIVPEPDYVSVLSFSPE